MNHKVLVLLLIGLFLLPVYFTLSADGTAIENNVWYVGQDVDVDLSFMPIVPQRIEYSVYPYTTNRESSITRYAGTYSSLYSDDTSWLTYQAWSSTDSAISVTKVGGSFDLFYELRYTDVATIEYAMSTIGGLTTEFSFSSLLGYIASTDGNEVLFNTDIASGAHLTTSGSKNLNENYVIGNLVNVFVRTYGETNTLDYVYFRTTFDQFTLTFNNITDSEYHTEYMIDDDGDVSHRLFVESPEYRTQIAVDIPSHWVFDRTIPECDVRTSGGILYLENNTLPVDYEILFTETATETTSDESISSFGETLADDVLFYPDAILNGTEHVADTGDDDFADSRVLDTVVWAGGVLETANFTHPSGAVVEGFDYVCYGKADISAVTAALKVNDGTGWTTIRTLTTTEAWYNGTVWGKIIDRDTVMLGFVATGVAGFLIDYLAVKWHYMTLADDYHYAESFADVSDWTQEIGTITTDDDKASIAGPWTKRQNVSITGVSGAGTNYQVKLTVTYDDDMQSDFDDLRFYDNDGTTELDYWIETHTASTTATVWVEVRDNLDTDSSILMYYGNSAASTTSNGTATFLFFDDFENNNLDRWDKAGAYWSTVSDRVNGLGGTYSGFGDAEGTVGADRWLHTNSPYTDGYSTSDFAMHMWINTQVETSKEYLFRCSNNTNAAAYSLVGDQNDWYYDNGPYGIWEANTYLDDTWFEVDLAFDFTNDLYRLWLDTVSKGTQDLEDIDGIDITNLDSWEIVVDSGAGEDMWVDDCYIRNYVYGEPTVSSWGDEENIRSYVSFSSTDYFEYYYEFYVTSTTNTYNFQFYYGTSWVNITDSASTTGTISGIISDNNANAITRFGFLVSGGTFVIDYLRISPSTERGFSHDCSTTAGTDAGTTTGDLINVTSSITFDIDTTATAALIETSYYQFLDVFVDDGSGTILVEASADGSAWSLIVSNTTISADTHYRGNVLAASIDIKQIRVNATSWATLDFCQLYSIANYTVTQSGATIDDYLYVDSGTLYSSVDDGYIEANHDPVLAVNSATYPIYNLSTSTTAPEFSYYVSDWSTYSANTRGALSGTVTDIKLKFDSTEILSAITFTEISNNPIITDISYSPNPADGDENVVFTVTLTDSSIPLTVSMNAVEYPSGFSDVDYDYTMVSANVWTYTFSTMTAGYYRFVVTANNILVDVDSITLTVQEIGINLDPINQEGAEPSATHYQVSFVSNKAGLWSITEWTVVDGSDAAETNTGVVVVGWNNIAWEKLDTTSNVVYFNMTITSGSLSRVIPGLYLVAQTTFYVEYWTQSQSFTEVFIKGYITKTGAYAIYDANNTIKQTGTVSTNSFIIAFDMWTLNTLQDINFTIRFTNGSQVCYIYSSYYADDIGVYKGGGVVTGFSPDGPFWLMILIISTFGSAVVVGISRITGGGYGNLPNA